MTKRKDPMLNDTKAHEPKVGTDWHFEQVRSEINRLREVLRNPNLTDEERAIAQAQLENYLTTSRAK
jgi:hypothetical protein